MAAVPVSATAAAREGPVKGRLHMAAPLAITWSAKAILVPSGRLTVRRMLRTLLRRAGSLAMNSPLAEVRTVWPATVLPLSRLVRVSCMAALGDRPLPMAMMLVQVMSCSPTWRLDSAAEAAAGSDSAAASPRTATILRRRMLVILSGGGRPGRSAHRHRRGGGVDRQVVDQQAGPAGQGGGEDLHGQGGARPVGVVAHLEPLPLPGPGEPADAVDREPLAPAQLQQVDPDLHAGPAGPDPGGGVVPLALLEGGHRGVHDPRPPRLAAGQAQRPAALAAVDDPLQP